MRNPHAAEPVTAPRSTGSRNCDAAQSERAGPCRPSDRINNDRATRNKSAIRAADVETTNLLTRAVEHVAPMLADATKPTKERVRLLWAAAKTARDLAASDVVHEAFIAVALRTGLIDERGRWTGADIAEHRRNFGAQDIEHVVRWAVRGWNPFETGPLT
jgi:hypothetical protein